MERAAASLVAATVLPVFAGTYLWTGAVSSSWTDAANWTDENGAAVSKCPGARADDDSSVKWTNWTNDNDTAVFVGAGGGHTTIDATGLFSIRNVIIRGAATPVYTFPDAFPLRSEGSFTVEAEVVNMPVMGSIALGVGFEDISGNIRMHKGNVDFYNFSASSLVFGDFVKAEANPEIPCTSGKTPFYWVRPRFHPRGAGGIRVTGSSAGITGNWRFYPAFCAAPYKTTLAADMTPFGIFFVKDVANEIARLEIAEGYTLGSLGATSDYNICYTGNDSDAEISGAGTYAPSFGSGWALMNCTVTISSCFNVPDGKDLLVGGNYGPTHVTFTSATDNQLSGDVRTTFNGEKLTTHSIGAPGVKSAFGAGSRITYTNETATKSVKAQELVYTGPGETSSRTLTLGRAAAGVLPFVLRQQGTGAWVVNMPIENGAANGLALTLDNATEQPAELATALADARRGGHRGREDRLRFRRSDLRSVRDARAFGRSFRARSDEEICASRSVGRRFRGSAEADERQPLLEASESRRPASSETIPRRSSDPSLIR